MTTRKWTATKTRSWSSSQAIRPQKAKYHFFQALAFAYDPTACGPVNENGKENWWWRHICASRGVTLDFWIACIWDMRTRRMRHFWCVSTSGMITSSGFVRWQKCRCA